MCNRVGSRGPLSARQRNAKWRFADGPIAVRFQIFTGIAVGRTISIGLVQTCAAYRHNRTHSFDTDGHVGKHRTTSIVHFWCGTFVEFLYLKVNLLEKTPFLPASLQRKQV